VVTIGVVKSGNLYTVKITVPPGVALDTEKFNLPLPGQVSITDQRTNYLIKEKKEVVLWLYSYIFLEAILTP
jgi:hypothetical protein